MNDKFGFCSEKKIMGGQAIFSYEWHDYPGSKNLLDLISTSNELDKMYVRAWYARTCVSST